MIVGFFFNLHGRPAIEPISIQNYAVFIEALMRRGTTDNLL